MSLCKRIQDLIATTKYIRNNKDIINSIITNLEGKNFKNIRLSKNNNMIYRIDSRFYFIANYNDIEVFIKVLDSKPQDEIEHSIKMSDIGIEIPKYINDGKIDEKCYFAVYTYLKKWHDIGSLKRLFFANRDIECFCDWLLKNLNILEANHMFINDFNGGVVMFKRYKASTYFSFVDPESFAPITDSINLKDYYTRITKIILNLFRRKKHFLNSVESFKIIKARGMNLYEKAI